MASKNTASTPSERLGDSLLANGEGLHNSTAVDNILKNASDSDRSNVVTDKFTFSLVFSAMVALLGSFQFGYHIGVINAPKDDIISAIGGDMETLWPLAVSIWAIGGWIGGSFGGVIADKLGRKTALLMNNVFLLIGGGGMYAASAPWHMVVSRFIAGIGCGVITVTVPMYLGEIAPSNLRGTLGTCNQLGCVIGILVSNVLGFPLENDPGFWRLLLGISVIPSLLQMFFAIFFFHESPRWILTVHKNRALATSTLRQLRGYKDVDVEIESIVMSNVESAGEKEGSIWDVLNDKELRKPLLIGVVLQIAQQWTGINAIMFYSSEFFKKIHGISPIVGTVMVGAVNAAFTLVSVALIEKLGRRFLLMLGTFIMLISSVILTAALFMPGDAWAYIAITCILVYVAAFEIGLGPIAWLMIAEIFPTKNRGPAMSVAVAVNWICTFTIGQGFPTMFNYLNNLVFVPFIGVMVAFLAFGYFGGLIETQGKTLEEIQDELKRRGKSKDEIGLLDEQKKHLSMKSP